MFLLFHFRFPTAQILVEFDTSSADDGRACDRSFRRNDGNIDDGAKKFGNGSVVADHPHLREQIQASGRNVEAASGELSSSGGRVHAADESPLRPVVGLGQGISDPEASEDREGSKDHQVGDVSKVFVQLPKNRCDVPRSNS